MTKQGAYLSRRKLRGYWDIPGGHREEVNPHAMGWRLLAIESSTMQNVRFIKDLCYFNLKLAIPE
jgi:hypothetical protein